MTGKVYLVGAGPGDEKLITLRGLEAIKDADVIVYDRLANPKLLKHAKKGCKLIYVGKKPNHHTMPQEAINQLLIDEAKKGKTVTRLKGGDPYVFGRGGEEGIALHDTDIPFEVIPGITSAIGGLAYAGIPITHRGVATSFHVMTGHLKGDDQALNWKALADLDGTLVFLMGVSNLKEISENLMAYGKAGDTPAAIINWATRGNQRVVSAPLKDIYRVAQEEGISSPSLIVIGKVVAFRETLSFFERKALFGKRIVVTRSRAQNSKLVEKIQALGGQPVEFPTIKISPILPNTELEGAIQNLETYTYIIFTSQNAVSIFFKTLDQLGFDARKLANLKVVAIGPATVKVLENRGIKPDIVPEKYIGEHILAALKDVLKKEDRLLIPRSKNGRTILIDALKDLAQVEEIHIYETQRGGGKKEIILDQLKKKAIDYITFTSSSTVENFMTLLGGENIGLLDDVNLISIGPITSEKIKTYGLKVDREAKDYTIDGLLDCMVTDMREANNHGHYQTT